jgi:hypothetical protein
LSHTENTLIELTISSPISFYAQFLNANASSKNAFAQKWDIFVFGTSSSLDIEG